VINFQLFVGQLQLSADPARILINLRETMLLTDISKDSLWDSAKPGLSLEI